MGEFKNNKRDGMIKQYWKKQIGGNWNEAIWFVFILVVVMVLLILRTVNHQ